MLIRVEVGVGPTSVPMTIVRPPLCFRVAVLFGLAACSGMTTPRPPAASDDTTVAERDDASPETDAGSTPAPGPILAGGNRTIRSFDEAKRALQRIYAHERVDLYCGCTFFPSPGHGFQVDLAGCGYATLRDPVRAARIEWEHAVAAATFGRTFTEWTRGDPRCIDPKGKPFRGRKCAGKVAEFSRMEGDLHNLFPVVGEVNAVRGDLPMGILDPPDRTPANHKPTNDVFAFGKCKSTIDHGVFLPRPEVRGDIARAALYMNAAYPDHPSLDEAHRQLFERWSTDDPPDRWERERDRLVTEAQGNGNPFIEAVATVSDGGPGSRTRGPQRERRDH